MFGKLNETDRLLNDSSVKVSFSKNRILTKTKFCFSENQVYRITELRVVSKKNFLSRLHQTLDQDRISPIMSSPI